MFDRRDLDSTSHNMLREVLAEPGQPIVADVRWRMEYGLAADFADVVVHTSPLAHALNHRLRATAFTLGNHICFSAGAYDPGPWHGTVLLAHELAHVVQQRLGRSTRRQTAPSTQSRMLEAEADFAAASVLRGEQYVCKLSDDSGLPACWDLAGHFYTPYLMFLNAGVDKDTAKRLALWCWLPDQVEELDAAYVAEPHLSFTDQCDHARENFAKCELAASKNTGLLARKYQDAHQYIRVVHRGLHVFTGASALDETKKRMKKFSDLAAGTPLLFRGLALHPFGDCFAHRQLSIGASGAVSQFLTEGSDTLYDSPFGHARDGHDIDHIFHQGRGLVFVAYVRALDELANKYRNKQAGQGTVSINDMIAALSAMVRGVSTYTDGHKAFGFSWSELKPAATKLAALTVPETEAGCCDHIRRIASDLVGVKMDELNPNEEPVPWSQYCNRKDYRSWLVQDSGGEHDVEQILYKIQKYTVDWSGEALPFQRQR